MSSRYRLSRGSVVFTERSDALPVVGVGIHFRIGSLLDPKGREGLTRLWLRSLRMGTRGMRAQRLEERLDALGAVLSAGCSQSYAYVGGVVVAHNLEPFVQLLAALLSEPALRPGDIAKVKRETVAQLVASTDDDGTLLRRHFRGYALGRHLYGRPVTGTVASVRGLSADDVRAHHERQMTAPNLVFGLWGDFEPAPARALLERHFGHLPRRKAPGGTLPALRWPRGRRLLLIDKPERAQTQIAIGTVATHPADGEHVPLWVGNAAFGGLFTSRLTTEVRAKRGWSYGATSSLVQSRIRDLWAMHTAPAASDARACIELQLGLLERWVDKGVTERELRQAKSYLVKSHAFDVDTASKRLDEDLDDDLMDWPRGFQRRFVERVKRVQRPDVARALRRRISPDDLAIAVVATASELGPELERLPGIARVDVVPYDRV